jgi:hypothetical protein
MIHMFLQELLIPTVRMTIAQLKSVILTTEIPKGRCEQTVVVFVDLLPRKSGFNLRKPTRPKCTVGRPADVLYSAETSRLS